MGIYYRRHLPHYQPEGETYHVVFRLAGSIPSSVLEELRFKKQQEEERIAKAKSGEEKVALFRSVRWEHFERIEKLLDGNVHGPFWLREPGIAAIVDEAIRYRDGKEYNLIAHTIMPNHVHLIFELLIKKEKGQNEETSNKPRRSTGLVDHKAGSLRRRDSSTYTVTNILENLKWYTALKANRVLKRQGAFWQHESYDHVIRSAEELERTIRYVLENPVKAGLCEDWRAWQWTYVKPGHAGE